MIDNYRDFHVTDLFGKSWHVSYRWAQNAISIRHADTIDVKFEVTSGTLTEEKVIALPHPLLLKLSASAGRPITDPWCGKLAALHLKRMFETGEDIEKTLVTCTLPDLEAYAIELPQPMGIFT